MMLVDKILNHNSTLRSANNQMINSGRTVCNKDEDGSDARTNMNTSHKMQSTGSMYRNYSGMDKSLVGQKIILQVALQRTWCIKASGCSKL